MFIRSVGVTGLSWDLGTPQEERLGPQARVYCWGAEGPVLRHRPGPPGAARCGVPAAAAGSAGTPAPDRATGRS